MVLEYDEMINSQASGLWPRLDVNINSLQPNPFEMNLSLYTVIRTISKICMWLLMMMINIYRICDYLNFWAQFSVVHNYKFVLSTYLQRMYDQMNADLSTYVKDIWNWIFEFWCLTPLSAIFQLPGISWRPVLVVGKPEYPERTTDPGQATGKLYHLRLRVECTFFVINKVERKPMAYWW
jgi:hypothetical protein